MIEDDTISRILLTDVLRNEGYFVRDINSAIFLEVSLQKFLPDLILLDLKLPDVEGFTVLEWLKTDRIWAETPVFVVSACASIEDRKRAIELGADRYFLKPFDLHKLLAAIEFEVEAIECRKAKDIS